MNTTRPETNSQTFATRLYAAAEGILWGAHLAGRKASSHEAAVKSPDTKP